MSRTHLLPWSCGAVAIAAFLAGGAKNVAATPGPASMPPSTPLAISGEMVDGDLPATYRLPAVAPFPSASVAVARKTLPLFMPPLPPELVERAPQVTPFVPVANVAAAPTLSESDPPQQEISATTPAGSPPDELSTVPAGSDSQAKVPTTTDLAVQLLPAVQRGYVLAQRGALFAARTEFVQVLRRVAQAKDVAAKSDEHSQALAAGLRALDEAEDFVPDGVQLEAELDVPATASSHRTPVLGDHPEKMLPHEVVVLYHQFAEQQLAQAVDGERPGSMALYGLGRIYAQLAERRDDDVRFVRGAMTMFSAALAACPHNHLAANELGVLVCRTGQPTESVRLFERTIDLAPSATAYHNMAVAQRKIGMHARAQANEQESQRLAAWERANGTLSRRAGIQWVAPAEMARVAQPGAVTPPPTASAANPQPAGKSPWQWTAELTKSLPRPGSGAYDATLDPMPRARIARPVAQPNQTQWR